MLQWYITLKLYFYLLPYQKKCLFFSCHYEEKGTSDGEKDPNSNLSVKTSGDEMNPEIDHSISQS